jgi:putative alpha-1,2-mannosidase
MMLLSILFALRGLVAGAASKENLTQHVNPFIGTEGQGNPGTAIGAGNVFPGAELPFGVVKFGIDTTAFDWTNVDANTGYTPDGYGETFCPLFDGSILSEEVTGESVCFMKVGLEEPRRMDSFTKCRSQL